MQLSRYPPNMASTETAAGRLYRILMDLRPRTNMALGEAWVQVLDVEGRADPELYRRLAIVVGLPTVIEKSIRELPDANHELLMRWQPKVMTVISLAHRFDESTSAVVGQYDDAVLLSLEHADDAVLHATRPASMAPDARESALAKISELLDALEGLAAPANIRALLIRHAVRLQDALRLYPLTGPEGVAEALYDATCALNAVAPNGADDEREPMARYARTLGFVADALQILTAVASIVPPVASWVAQIGS